MSDEEWEPFKPEIERLYCFEHKTLREVRDYMKRMYDFEKSEQQYQRQLKKWEFSKNQVQADEWKFINRRMKKRKRDNKESEVHVRGIEQPRKKVSAAARSKKTYEKTTDIIANALSPVTPEGIVVCTPVSPKLDLEWNTSLPWLRFVKLIQPENNQPVPSPSSSLVVPSPQNNGVSRQIVSRELMQRLSSILPWDKLHGSLNIHSSSQAATALTILMPEEGKDKHQKLSSSLSDSSHKNRECFKLELFLLSNNLFSHNHGDRTEETMDESDKHILEMFKQSGWNNVNHIRMLLSNSEPTAHAIVEKLFTSAIRRYDLGTVKIMLEAGMDADAIVETIENGPMIALHFACMFEDEPELAQLLLLHGAEVNSLRNGYSALEFAVQERNTPMVQMLLAKGATVTPSCLSRAVSYRTTDNIMMDILNACPLSEEQTDCQSSMALVHAVSSRNVDIIGPLLVRGAEVNALVDFDSGHHLAVTTVLGHAVMCCPTALPLLLWACHDINPEFDGLPYISPLVLAVHSGNAEATKLLLEANMDVTVADMQGTMTLLERATIKRNTGIWQLLIRYGALIERPLSDTGSVSSSPIMHAITGKIFDLAELLIDSGSRLNDEYTKAPGTVLGAAIESGHIPLITKVWTQGARVLNKHLRRIGNIQTAIYLQELMVLQTVLQISGERVLAAAILGADVDLPQYLIERDAAIGNKTTGFQDPESNPTPLRAAIRKRKFDFAETLLSRGAKVSEGDLAEAVTYFYRDDMVFFKRLLSSFHGNAPTAVENALLLIRPAGIYLEALREANVDPTGTPQRFEDFSYQEFLHESSPDFDLEPPQSVLETAVFVNPERLDFLLQWTPWDTRSIGRALVAAIIQKNDRLIDSLLQYSPEMSQEFVITYRIFDEDGDEKARQMEIFTPLQAAIKNQLVPVARILVKSSDVNYLGDGARRRTPLQYAVENGNMDLITMLLEHGAKVNGPPATDGGATALQIASLKGYIGIARRLIDIGAKVNEAPAKFNGRTALQGAAEYGRIDMLQMLFNEGVLVVGDYERQYQRAVELAEQNGHYVAARLLKGYRESSALGTL